MAAESGFGKGVRTLAESIRAEGPPNGRPLQVAAHAKVNLRLKLLGRRDDGYHLLSMLNHSISLHDDLALEFCAPEETRLEVLPVGMLTEPPERNLVLAAFNAFWREFGFLTPPIGVRVTLTKRIPIGAGLGGGSSDAAAMLRVLWRLFGAAIGVELGRDKESMVPQLARVALTCGADVPYTLHGGLCAVSGIGEVVAPVPGRFYPHHRIVVMVPQVSISTAQLFAHLRRRQPHSALSEDQALQSYCAARADSPHAQLLLTLIENDFEGAVCELAPEVARGLQHARQFFPHTTAVSGSGSAFFSLITPGHADQMDALCCALRTAGYTVHQCSFVDSSAEETGQ